MDTEDAAVDEGGEREVVKHISAVAPDVDRAVLAQALVVEAINLGPRFREGPWVRPTYTGTRRASYQVRVL